MEYVSTTSPGINARRVNYSSTSCSHFPELSKLKIRSCSVECYKSHQCHHADATSLVASQGILNGLPPKPQAAAISTGTSDSQINGRGAPFGQCSLTILETPDDDLHTLYERYPRLRCQLKHIYDAAIEPLDNQLNDQLFGNEHGDRKGGRGRERGQGRDARTAAKWSRQKGIKSGIHRLRKLRHIKGEDGDGLREFSKLVASLSKDIKSTNKAPGV